MAEKLDPKGRVTIEELAISTMWKIAASVELLERKGTLTRQGVLDMMQRCASANPRHLASVTQQLRDSRPYVAKVARTVQLPTLGVAYPRTEDVGLLREELVMG